MRTWNYEKLKYIQDLHYIAAPLSDATQKGAPEKVSWSSEWEKAFSTLKERLTARPVLWLLDLSKLFTIHTDATLG